MSHLLCSFGENSRGHGKLLSRLESCAALSLLKGVRFLPSNGNGISRKEASPKSGQRMAASGELAQQVATNQRNLMDYLIAIAAMAFVAACASIVYKAPPEN